MLKRGFDLVLSFVGLTFFGFVILLFCCIAAVDTKSNGLFVQNRIGQFGHFFKIYKLRTIHPTTKKISKVGKFLRNSKIDEWPQLINILFGNMSVVGPRPDIPGYYDLLEGKNRKILELKPGLTSEASIKYYNEEEILAIQDNPEKYNDEVIFPDKVKMNLEYYRNRSFLGDLKIIWKTVFRK